MRQKWISLLCALALAVSLAGCGGSSNGSAAVYDLGDGAPPSSPSAEPMETTEETGGYHSAASSDISGVSLPTDGRKIILNASLSIEALDFDATCTALLQALKDADGYVASTELYTPSYEGARRSAAYELRVPAAKYEIFLQNAGSAGNLINRQESTEDVTRAYVDVEARLKSLRLQEERLYAMMEQAGELETLLAIQNQLTEVQYQLESYTSQRNTYDDLVSYSTVTVSVEEVRVFTEAPVTFADRVGEAFRSSWRGFGEGVQNFAVGVVYFLPALLVLCVLAAIAIPLVRAVSKRSRARLARQGQYAAARRPADYTAQYAGPEQAGGAAAEPAQPGRPAEPGEAKKPKY